LDGALINNIARDATDTIDDVVIDQNGLSRTQPAPSSSNPPPTPRLPHRLVNRRRQLDGAVEKVA